MPGLLCRMVSELHCLQLRRGPVTLPGGETRFGQCFGFCEEWYDACQECEEEEILPALPAARRTRGRLRGRQLSSQLVTL